MRYILLILFWLALLDAMAQQPLVVDSVKKNKNETVKIDSSKVKVRTFDEETITAYSKQKAFIYDDVAPENLSWWDRFWKSFWDFIRNVLSGGNGKSTGWLVKFAKYFAIIFAASIIVFVILKLLRFDLKMLIGKSKRVEVPYEEHLENIHEIDFNEQLEKALQSKNYRLAVRLLYLQTLKHLTDKEIIIWQPEKTNNNYLQEISNQNQQTEFGYLTYQFEYIWYGDFFIDQQQFESIDHLFQQFNQQFK